MSELENNLKTQLANKTQELSASEERVAKLEKKLKEAQTASVKVEQQTSRALDAAIARWLRAHLEAEQEQRQEAQQLKREARE